jgi:hypothetical protein
MTMNQRELLGRVPQMSHDPGFQCANEVSANRTVSRDATFG